MSVSYNRAIIAGNLTRDPQVRYLAGDKAVADFGMAMSRKFKGNDGETKEETTFVDVEAWGRTAELAGQYLAKGRPCLVEGRLKLDAWEDKETHQKRSKLKVIAETIQFLGSRYAPADEPGDDAPPAPRPSRPDPAGAGGYDSPPFSRSDLELMA